MIPVRAPVIRETAMQTFSGVIRQPVESSFMRTASILMLSALLGFAAHAAPADTSCELSPSVLDVYRKPLSATSAEWRASRDAVNAVFATRCASGPRSAASRAVLFAVLEHEMTLDYDAVFAAWARQDGKPLSEGAGEGIAYFQKDLLEYLDRITAAKDVAHKDVILRYANGTAIAKLGRAVKKEVFKQAGTPPQHFYGLIEHNPQAEAMRAIGYWLRPSDDTLTADEKRDFALFVAGALPPDGHVLSGAHARAVETIVEALGNSDVPEIESKLRSWRHAYENASGTGTTIGRLAGEAADKVRSRAKKQTP